MCYATLESEELWHSVATTKVIQPGEQVSFPHGSDYFKTAGGLRLHKFRGIDEAGAYYYYAQPKIKRAVQPPPDWHSN